jgi:hypothetical protein
MSVHVDAAPVAPRTAGPSRPILWLTIALLALAVVAVAVVLLGGRASPATYPAGSPEAAYQAYLAAFDDPDPAIAYASLSRGVRARWPYDEYLMARDSASWQMQQDHRTWIDRVERSGDRATLHLTFEFSSGSGLNTSTWSDHREVRMVLEDGEWRIDQRLAGFDNY